MLQANAADVNFSTGDLTSSQGTTPAATALLTVTPAPAPTMAQAISPANIAQGAEATVTQTITNTALVAADTVSFSNPLLNGLTVSATPYATTTCVGGAITAVAGTTSVSFTMPSLAAGASCSVQYNVTSATVGGVTNTTGSLNSSLGTTPGSSAPLTVTAAGVPAFSKVFTPSTIVAGAESRLVYTLDNSTALIAATGAGFVDIFNASIVAAASPNITNTCGGSATSMAGSITLTGGTIPASGSCTVEISVRSNVDGVHGGTSGDLTTSLGNSGGAAGVLTVSAAPPITASLAFTPDTIPQGGISRMTVTLDNTAALIDEPDVNFFHLFPAGLAVAPTPNESTTCASGTVMAVPNDFLMDFIGGSVTAGTTCTVSVDVVGEEPDAHLNLPIVLFTSAGFSETDPAILTVTPAPLPDFSMAFSPDTIVQGDTSALLYVVDNSAALVETGPLFFSHDFTGGVSMISVGRNTCGGSVLRTASGFSYDGTSVAAGGSCDVELIVTSATVGAAPNLTSTLVTDLGVSAAANDTLTVTAAPVPTVAKTFTPDSIVQGGTSRMVISLDNTSALISADNLVVSNMLPTGVTVADTPNLSTTCIGGTLGGSAGDSTVTYNGGALPASGTCEVGVNVVGVTTGVFTNASADIVTILGNSGPATANLTVTGAPAPIFTKAFADASMVQGDTTTLVFTIDNSAALIDATSIAVVDPLPAGMVIADVPNYITDCTAGAVDAVIGGNMITVTNGVVDAGTVCTASVDVTATTVGTATNVTGDLTSDLGNSGPATASMNITAAPAPTFTKQYAPDTIAQGGVSTVLFTIDNTTALVSADDMAFNEGLPTGMVLATPPNLTSNCTGATLTGVAGDAGFSMADASLAAGANCQVSADVSSVTVGAATVASGELTSTLGNSGTASATLTVTAAPLPGIAMAFAPDTIVQGDISTMTLTLDNTAALIAATNVTLSNTLPTGMTVASTPNASTTCTGGTLTATADAGSVSYAAGEIAGSGSCTITVDVRAVTAGAQVNTTDDMTSDLGNSGTASATLTVTSAAAPTFAMAFNPTTITQNSTSTVTFTIDNAANLIEASALSFAGTLGGGMSVAATPNATTTCTGGTVSATAAATAVSLSGGTVAAGASCTVTLDVTSSTPGTSTLSVADLTSSLGSSGGASASLLVQQAPPPDFTNFLTPATIIQGGTTTVVFTINNGNSFLPANGMGFVIVLPNGLTIQAGAPAGLRQQARVQMAMVSAMATSNCGGTLTATGGSNTISLTGGSVPARSSCEIRVPLTSDIVGTIPAIQGTLTSSLGSSPVVASGGSGTVTVIPDPEGRVTFVQTASEDGTFTFSSATAALNFTIATSGGSGSFGPIDLPVGNYTVTQSRPDGVGNTSITCSDSDSTGSAASGVISLNVASFESITCRISSLSTQTKTTEVINSFLNRRNNMILTNGPSRARRMARLNRGSDGVERLRYSNGDLESMLPVTANLRSMSGGNYEFSTSLLKAERAAAMFLLAHDGIKDNERTIQKRKFDIWFEGSYHKFAASQGSKGHFGIAYLGADYLVNPDLLVGALVQFDSMEDSSDTTNSSVSGTGWMIGPYVTTRLADNLYFDGRFALGKSNNKVSPFNTYTDTFKTDRWLVDATLSGNYQFERWQVSPNISLSYIQDKQKAYTDSLNVAIPEQTVSLGQIKFGPDFSTQFVGTNQTLFEPRFAIDGIYNFGNRKGAMIANDTAGETNGWRGRIEAGIAITTTEGVQVELGANYDGIGQKDFESYGASIKVTIPLN